LKVDLRPIQPMPKYVDTYDEFRAFIESWGGGEMYPDDGISPWGQYFEIEKVHQQYIWWEGNCRAGEEQLMPQGVPILKYAIVIFNAHKDKKDSHGNTVFEHEKIHRDHHVEALKKYSSKVWSYSGKCYCEPCPGLINAYLQQYRVLVDLHAVLKGFELDMYDDLVVKYTAKYEQQKMKVESALNEITNKCR
jgi:hypothetical protein